MREKQIEQKLVIEVKKSDGLCFKLTGMIGIPDRMVLMPHGKIGFVEVKALGKKPRAIQVKRITLLRGLGFKCFVLDDVAKIGGIIHEIQST
ncbi:VRR-NUC domain-containing protein [Tuanshanicoccus lijuaniae]|uniref:VRR-NUC domain-containing protein n=1 Tax=Aerococcaceae bacterium zg-1292 TaxID=2774330 RepID=UPI001935B048|nr:VRR-NUC domain-containing protein [Aerococcaceae bacterium zg-1292]QQA38038.1 VRR-NUC domain-containing protein [Aerococcaceae bacterium zg-1292]